MINLTNEEFSQVIGEVFKEVKEKDSDLAFFVIVFGAMIGARAEMKTEKKEDEEEEFEAVVEYNVGNKNISITTMTNDKVRLVIKCNGIVAVDRTLDSLYKAYNYAFNIICH